MFYAVEAGSKMNFPKSIKAQTKLLTISLLR